MKSQKRKIFTKYYTNVKSFHDLLSTIKWLKVHHKAISAVQCREVQCTQCREVQCTQCSAVQGRAVQGRSTLSPAWDWHESCSSGLVCNFLDCTKLIELPVWLIQYFGPEIWRKHQREYSIYIMAQPGKKQRNLTDYCLDNLFGLMLLSDFMWLCKGIFSIFLLNLCVCLSSRLAIVSRPGRSQGLLYNHLFD